MSTACTFSVTDRFGIDKTFRNSNWFQIWNNIGTAVELTHIYPCMVDTTGVFSNNYRTGSNIWTVGTLPIRTVRGLNILLFNIDFWSHTVISDCAVIADCQPVIGIHRNGVVPWKSRCFVSKLRQRIVHKSRTVDAEIIYRLHRQRSILSLIVCVPVPLIPKCIRCSEQSCRLCDHRIGRRKRRVFGRSTCGICCYRSAHRWTEHRKSAEACHKPCAKLL